MKINKQFILFDLDGTVSDSKTGILKSMQYACRHFGIDIKDEQLNSYSFFLGPPLKEGFKKIKDFAYFTEEELETAVIKYREYYIPTGMFENELYPGVKELLGKLKNSGKTVVLATSKAEKLAKEILEYFDIAKYFDFAAGAELDGRRSKKSEVILYALDKCGVKSAEEKARAIMIGDRNLDINGAAQAGIESVGVLYGYGSEEELTSGEFKADYLVKDTDELEKLLIKKRGVNYL